MIPLNPAKIPTMYQKALRLQNTGKLDDAFKIYAAIANANPRIAEVHFQFGRIYQSTRQSEKAADHFQQAAQIKPGEVAIWNALADTLLILDDPKRSSEFLKNVRSSGLPEKECNRLVAKLSQPRTHSTSSLGAANKKDIDELVSHMGHGRFGKAEELGLRLQARHPNVAVIANILASAQVSLNKPQLAIPNFEKAIALDPKYAEAHSNYGRLLVELGENDEAIAQLEKALKLTPNMPLALCNMGAALLKAGNEKEAEKYLLKSIKKNPKFGQAHARLANLYWKHSEHDKVIKSCKSAIRYGFKTPDTFVLLGKAQAALGQDSEAMKNYDAAIKLDAGYDSAHFEKALLLQFQANFEEAKVVSRQAIELAPDSANNYRIFVMSNKLDADDPLIEKMIQKFNDPATTDVNRRSFGFALAKVMEDTGQYDQVFKYLNAANQIVHKLHPYDIKTRRTEIDIAMKAFEGVRMSDFGNVGYADYAPIFVTGMPRSGTTLVEQIISSHSTITGAGEIGRISKEAMKLVTNHGKGVRSLLDFDKDEFRNLGLDYAEFMRKRLPKASRVSDKSIQTYHFLGLVKLALPNSRIVVVRRDPRDNLLSIYKNVFNEGTHLYAYNLRILGLYYKLFEEIIDFWRGLTPESFYEIQYEDLIANPEEESRKLIAACGLDWEDQCLNFHQNKRRVETLSVYQVRQPIYKSSLKGWQRYESELSELFEVLELDGDASK